MEIDKVLQEKDSQGIRVEQQVKAHHEFKLIGKVKKIPGLTLFSYNKKTLQIKKADVESKVSIGFDRKPKTEHKIITEKDCFYVQALNVKSAAKKLRKLGYTVKEA